MCFAVCRWVTGSISRAQYATVAEYYEFFPLVCLMSNYDADEELSKTCVSMLAMMGQALTLPQHVPVVLQFVSKVSDSLSCDMLQASHRDGPGSI
jgi:proteasome activator subunit 4